MNHTDTTVHAALAPIRNHARLSPLERLNVDATAVLYTLIDAMRGADARTVAHVAETLDALMPRLYDLWDAAAHVRYHRPWATFLAPLARAGSAPESWDYEAYPEGPEPMGSDLDDALMLSVLRTLH